MNKLHIALVVAAVALGIYISTIPAGSMQALQAGFIGVLSPFLKTGTAVQENLGTVGKRLKTLDELEVENDRLARENSELRTANNLLNDLKVENDRLRLALDFRERSPFRLTPAHIIGRDASTWWNTIRINRGFEDGVEADMPVLTDQGVVGKTTTVSKNEAIVVLVTDETCRIASRIEGTREQGILTGQRVQKNATNPVLQLNFLSKNARLEPGQLVVTAGVSRGSFPAGIPIGKVTEFKLRALDGQALVEPLVPLALIEDVFVLTAAK